MPVILPHAAQEAWLDPKSRNMDLLTPDADTLELIPVSARR
jgi:putative SOS response-associated peptidase YedK